jgi:hypothetical protein
MKKSIGAIIASAGLLAGLPALAQNTTTVVTPDQATVVTQNGYDTTTTTYPTTGWDTGLLMLASGGLALGSVTLKGFAKRRA